MDAAIDAKASAAGQPEPDMAPKLAKTAANDLMAAQLVEAYETLKQDRLDLFEELQTLQPKEGRVYGLEELKQQKKQNRNLRVLALKRLSTDPVPDASSTDYATKLDAYKADKERVSSEIQVLQAEEDKIDLQMEEQSTHFDPAEMHMSMVGHADNEADKFKYVLARDRDRRTRRAKMCSPGLRIIRGQETPNPI